jgi:exopolyphosphatase/pppGpp-phosphohydrolase
MNLNNVNPNGNPEEIANAALTLFSSRRRDGDEEVGLVSYAARKARWDEKLTELYDKRHKNFERIFSLSRTYTAMHSRRTKKTIEDLEQHEVEIALKVERYQLKRLRLAQEFVENKICTNPTFY